MDESKRYTRWEEVVVSTDKGKREVHYYLKDSCGNSDLAVVGRERSLRHMTYETIDGFLRSCHLESLSPHRSPLTDGSMALKWKTRREVVDWLSSLVSGCTTYRLSPAPTDDRFSDHEDLDHMDGPSNIIITSSIPNNQQSKNFSWLGSSWTCRKRRKHYRSFCRRGITISVHDFVYIMAEENKRLVAYVDDLYEDMREINMVSVRWFHKVDEVETSAILPSDVTDREIFFSLCFQDLSVECIDGLACVFNQAHFDQFHAEVRPNNRLYPYMCRRLIDNDDVRAFDVTQLQGYWSQEALRSMYAPTSLKLRLKISTGKKRKRDAIGVDEKNAVKSASGKWQPLPGQLVEVLSQDSGIRGCWFRCIILRKHQDRIKVQYLDILDADGTGKLEEWVCCSRAAVVDDLSIRVGGRSTVRPAPLSNRPIPSSDCSFNIGSMVDAQWMDGWWEGVVTHCESDDKIEVYFPGEKRTSTFAPRQLRHSSEWVDGKWSPVKERKDIVASICSTIDKRQNETGSPEEMKSETLRETGSPSDDIAQEKCTTSSADLRKDLMLDGLKWSSRKRRRYSPIRVKRSPGSSSGCTEEETEPSACGSFVLLDSSGHEQCKIGRDSLFNMPAISNLVMSL